MRHLLFALVCLAGILSSSYADSPMPCGVKTEVNFNFKGLVAPVQKQRADALAAAAAAAEEEEAQKPAGPSMTRTAVDHTFGNVSYESQLFYQNLGGSAARPGVLIVPDFIGIEPEHQELARQYAEKGHVVLIVDTLGTGVRYERQVASQVITAWDAYSQIGNDHFSAFMNSVHNVFVSENSKPEGDRAFFIDEALIACYGRGGGGRYCADYFRLGYPTNAHLDNPRAGFGVAPDVLKDRTYTGSIFAHIPYHDPSLTTQDVESFMTEMGDREVGDWMVHTYGGSTGCFTDRGAEFLVASGIWNEDACSYNARDAARARAIIDMTMQEKFGL